MKHRSSFAFDIVHLFVAAALVSGCEHNIVDPPLPAGAVQFTPPPVYARWWAETQACSRHTAELSGITWQLVPRVSEFQLNNQTVSGYWTEGTNSIVVGEGVRLDGSVVRHEMLHALTRTSGHSRVDFLENCAGIVSCTPDCVADAGVPPKIDPSLPVVSPDSLEVTVNLVPDQPSPAVDSGVFTMVISVRNPATHSVVGGLPQLTGGSSVVYSVTIRPTGGPGNVGSGLNAGYSIVDPSVVLFGPGETKHQYFDFRIGLSSTGTTLRAGIYDFTGSYGSHKAVLPAVIIGAQP